jgi:hypothetical protein
MVALAGWEKWQGRAPHGCGIPGPTREWLRSGSLEPAEAGLGLRCRDDGADLFGLVFPTVYLLFDEYRDL